MSVPLRRLVIGVDMQSLRMKPEDVEQTIETSQERSSDKKAGI